MNHYVLVTNPQHHVYMSGATNNKILRLDNFMMPVCWLTFLVVTFLGQPVQLLFTMMRFFLC